MPHTKRSRTATFLVRLWTESDEEPRHAFRGQVEHVQSGDSCYVRDMNQVIRFIEERFDEHLAGSGQGGIR
jgi:hypothetical protein